MHISKPTKKKNQYLTVWCIFCSQTGLGWGISTVTRRRWMLLSWKLVLWLSLFEVKCTSWTLPRWLAPPPPPPSPGALLTHKSCTRHVPVQNNTHTCTHTCTYAPMYTQLNASTWYELHVAMETECVPLITQVSTGQCHLKDRVHPR